MLGSSHLGAVVLGWKALRADHPEIDMTFMGAPSNMLSDLVLEDGVLRPAGEPLRAFLATLPECAQEIVVADHDEFCLVGMGFGPHAVMRLYRECWPEDCADTADHRVPVSASLFRQIARAHLLGTLAARLHRTVRSVSDRPIAVVPRPWPSEPAVTSPGPYEAWHEARHLAEEAVLSDHFAAAGELLKRDGITVFLQPPETLACPTLTRYDLSRGSVRFRSGFKIAHPDTDFDHMNADFGISLLKTHIL